MTGIEPASDGLNRSTTLKQHLMFIFLLQYSFLTISLLFLIKVTGSGSSVHLLYRLSYLSFSREWAGIEPATQCSYSRSMIPKRHLIFLSGLQSKQTFTTECSLFYTICYAEQDSNLHYCSPTKQFCFTAPVFLFSIVLSCIFSSFAEIYCALR